MTENASRAVRWPYAVIILVAFLSSAPLVFLGVLPVANDRVQHQSSDLHFRQQVFEGEWYPRWLAGANASLGSPGLFVYSPVPYYVSALLDLPIAPFRSRVRPFLSLDLSAALAFTLSGMACLLWLDRIAPRAGALAGSIVYLLLPFHFWGDLYIRYALSHLWAFVAIPLCLYAVVRIAEQTRFGLMVFAASYALLVCSHLLVAFLFTPFLLLYACFFVAMKTVPVRYMAIDVATGGILGLGIAAVYLLPALEHMRAIPPTAATAIDIYNYRLNFLVLGGDLFRLSSDRRYPWYLTWYSISVVGEIGTLLLATRAWRDRPHSRQLWFWLGVVVLAGLMMTHASTFLWDASDFFHNTIDFPWRYYAVVTPATAAIFALGIGATARSRRVAAWAACGLVAVIAMFQLAHVGRMYSNRTPPPEMTVESQISGDMFRHYAFKSADASFLEQSTLQTEVPLIPSVAVVTGTGAAAMRSTQPRNLEVDVTCPNGCTIRLKQFYYRFWRASVEGTQEPLSVRPSPRRGLLDVVVPPGAHAVRVIIPFSLAERSGLWLTVCSLAVATLSPHLRRRAPCRRNHHATPGRHT
jgi:hypothetical protein